MRSLKNTVIISHWIKEFMLEKFIVGAFTVLLVYGLMFLSKKAENVSKELGWDKDLEEESRKRKERMESIRNSSIEKEDKE